MKEKNLDLLKNSNNNNYERNKFSKINLIYRKYILTERRDKNKKNKVKIFELFYLLML